MSCEISLEGQTTGLSRVSQDDPRFFGQDFSQSPTLVYAISNSALKGSNFPVWLRVRRASTLSPNFQSA